MQHKEAVQLLANYSQILSLPLLVVSVIFTVYGPLKSTSPTSIPTPISAGPPSQQSSPTPSPWSPPVDPNHFTPEPYRGMNRFFGNTPIDHFFQNSFILVWRWVQEDPVDAVIGAGGVIMAFLLWIFGTSLKRSLKRSPVSGNRA
jgi:hypothetical protein